ncbi:MAG: hypothetical protein GW903_05955 [Alphaproteobacteria bacterium]|nr:hypothetical protein [Alphaproteobacteria bacterium]NCQ88424.1 hypothetical protein [Alphaproteobacteria bacterium]NCT05966.1 hypothetical protein [Alphaproteobacteria bacterium]
MTKQHSFLSLLIISIFILIVPFGNFAKAQPTTPPPTGASCSWDEFLERLGRQETGFVCSGGGPCDRQYTTCSDRPDESSCGKWQFIPSTWDSMVGQQYPQCMGMSRAIASECWPVQKWATERFMERAVNHFKGNDWCGKLGQTVTGTHQGTTLTCAISKSGLLSAYHNAGTNACPFANGNSRWTSQINWRICDAGNIPFPEECTPSGQPPTVGPNITPNNNPNLYTPSPTGPGFDRPTHFEQLSETLKNLWVASFQAMTNQLTTTMMMQVQTIGMFFDAKHQMETQRLLQEKYAQAHKDYRPTVQMCNIGTMARDLGISSRRADLTHITLSQQMLSRALASGDTKTVDGEVSDKATRIKEYIDTYCDVDDNNRNNRLLCKNSSGPVDEQNIDIDFTRLIDMPLTLNVDFNNPAPTSGGTADQQQQAKTEKHLFAFLDNIFMHQAFPYIPAGNSTLQSFVVPYQEARALMAMRSVAQNSFSHIIAMKTAGHKTAGQNNAPYLKAFLVEIGLDPTEVDEYLGTNPSINAQRKLISQLILHPQFIENLQTNKVNVRRIRTALTAFKLMQERDISETLERRQMLISMILELELREEQEELQVNINNIVGRGP